MDRLIAALDVQFSQLHKDSVRLVEAVSVDELFRRPLTTNSSYVKSCGEELLRSVRTVEQTFGGITVSLWDDPVEWTQPETLATSARVLKYLEEVEATRKRGFD